MMGTLYKKHCNIIEVYDKMQCYHYGGLRKLTHQRLRFTYKLHDKISF